MSLRREFALSIDSCIAKCPVLYLDCVIHFSSIFGPEIYLFFPPKSSIENF